MLAQTGVSFAPIARAAEGTTVSLGATVLRVSSDSEYRQNAATAKCPQGHVVVSIGYQDSHRGNSDIVNALGIICAKLESNGTLGARTGRIYAGQLGSRTFYDIGCPSGMVVFGAYTKDFPLNSENSDFLDGYSPQCRSISAAGLGNAMGYLGNSDLDGSTRNLANFQCGSGEVVTGVVERDFDGKYAANYTATDSYDWYCTKIIVTQTQRPQCSDGVDNADAEDVLVDSQDPGCHSDGNPNNPGSYNPNDNDETNQVQKPQCSDGIDNDGDGKVDFNDPGCYTNGQYNPNDNDETNTSYPCSWCSFTDEATGVQVNNGWLFDWANQQGWNWGN